MAPDCLTGSYDVDFVITKALYARSDGLQGQISLIDALKPLSTNIPSDSQILLSNKPIVKQWPLAINDQECIQPKKRRLSKDDMESRLEDMKRSINVDIAQALAQLRIEVKKGKSDWLTRVPNGDYSIAPHHCSQLEWPKMEAIEDADPVKMGILEINIRLESVGDFEIKELIHRLVKNSGEEHKEIKILTSHSASIPSRSAFLITNLLQSHVNCPSGWSYLIKHASVYPPTLILLDPPYPNMSAGRLKKQASKYQPISDLYDLWKIKVPLQQILDCAAKGKPALVGCWVTNHAKIQRFILEKLFPALGLQHIGQLVWIKVTASDGNNVHDAGGDLVYPLDNKQGRKPYEILLLGQRRSNFSSLTITDLFASVPLDHSRKPYILDLLRKYLPVEAPINVYEFFARMISSGPDHDGHWTSIGNEPFKFNQKGCGYIDKLQRG